MRFVRIRRRSPTPAAALVASLIGGATAACAADGPELLVSAASSLEPALRDVARVFEAETGVRVRFNFASTGQLAHQIERGAPVDLFAVAHGSYLDALDAAGLLRHESRRPFARGRLALVAAPDTPVLRRLNALAEPGVERVAVAHPDHAPYGLAARRALVAAGLWAAVEPKLVITESVEQAYRYAAAGNVDAALVAASLLPGDHPHLLVEDALHGPLDHEIAVVGAAPRPQAALRFAEFLLEPTAREILRRHGLNPWPGR